MGTREVKRNNERAKKKKKNYGKESEGDRKERNREKSD